MDRLRELEAARRIDWRFLLPTPALGRLAVIGAVEPTVEAALIASADAVGGGTAAELARHGPWDTVLVDGPAAMDAAAIEHALELLRPGGWLVANRPGGAHAGIRLSRDMRRVAALGSESVQGMWYLPDRARALRVVPLADREALNVALGRHGGSVTTRVAAAAGRGLVRAGIGAGVLGGETGILARRTGGEPLRGWACLEPIASTLDEHGLERPSWILLTPRFPASAHVVMLLLAHGAVRLVAKIARLAGDGGPRHEAAILTALRDGGMAAEAAPRLVAVTEAAGHAVLLEEALKGRALNRRLMREDPARWIREATAWLSALPGPGPGGPGRIGHLVGDPLRRLRGVRSEDRGLADLVGRTLDSLGPLDAVDLPSVFEHGDLGHPNLLVRSDGGLAVIDWELARPDGLPLHDLTFFLGYVALATGTDDEDPADGMERVLAHPSWGAAAALRAEARRSGVAPEAVPALLMACWVRSYAGLALRGGAPEPGRHFSRDSASRYHRLWEGAVHRQAQLGALLA